MLQLAVNLRRFIQHHHGMPSWLYIAIWRVSEVLGVNAYGENFTADYNVDQFIGL